MYTALHCTALPTRVSQEYFDLPSKTEKSMTSKHRHACISRGNVSVSRLRAPKPPKWAIFLNWPKQKLAKLAKLVKMAKLVKLHNFIAPYVIFPT
jgi:hypothetical protein